MLNKLKHVSPAFVFLTMITISCNTKQEIKSGKELIENMNTKYKDNWYRYLTFTQQTTFYKEGAKDREQTWYEAMDARYGLVIKFDSSGSGSGYLFANDSIAVYKNDTLKNKSRMVHELLVLGFTVYTEPTQKTMDKLKECGFNTDIIQQQIVNGKNHYAVGDSAIAQFWIDAETMLFTKLRKKQKDGSVSEIQFANYQQLEKGWIAPLVDFYKNGKQTQKEEYNNIKTPASLSDSYYKWKKFSELRW